jgi:putative acetyltransferase
MTGSMFDIREDDLSSAATRALVALHLQGMRANTPPEAVYALDVSGLTAPGVTVWTVWDRDAVVAMGALKRLGDSTGEVKSMRTHPDHLRRGAAAQLLDHIIDEAKARGLKRLSLETGRGPAFDAALALYRKRGFVNGAMFSDYVASAFNQFLHLEL